MTLTPAFTVVQGGKDAAALPPPHNEEVEQYFLGALLHSNQQYFKTFEIVTADDFYNPLHARLYDAIAKTIDAGRTADAHTLRGMFDADAALVKLGGGRYLADLVASVITLDGVVDYARLIHHLAVRRRLLDYADEVAAMARNESAPPENADDLIGAAETRLYALAEVREGGGAVNMATAYDETMATIEDAMRRGNGLSGVPCGLPTLDKMLGGFEGGNLYVLSGRPSMGKTALCLTMAVNVAQTGAKALVQSMEMSRSQIMGRLIARQTGIPTDRQRAGLTQDEFGKIFKAKTEIASWPLAIDDSCGLTVAQIRGRAKRHKRRYGLSILVIDYLGFIRSEDLRANQAVQVGQITAALKSLAKELNIPVLLLSQLNRAVESREDKRPMMSDLRDSGSIEQDADVIMFVYRPEYYLVRSDPRRKDGESEEKFNDRHARWSAELEKSRHLGEIIVAKNRTGNTGTVRARFEGWRCHFYEPSPQLDEATEL